jgi:hypothetical protein
MGGDGEISSVTVGGIPFICNDSGESLESATISKVFGARDFIFNSPGGKLFSGKIEIEVFRSSGTITIMNLRVN